MAAADSRGGAMNVEEKASLPSTEAIDDDVPQDFEPGASRNCMLVPADSYDELEEELGSEQTQKENSRSGSAVSTVLESSNDKSGGDSIIAETQDRLEKLTVQTNFEDDSDDALNEEGVEEEPSPSSPVLAVEEDVNSAEWKKHKKHIFILSEAGKPIYSRHGKEDRLVTLMGVIQALVSFVQTNNDTLRSIVAGGHKFVFLNRGPIILVAVSQGDESVPQLIMQLNYLYNQILNLLTYTQLNQIFERRRNYDLRRLLSGAEKFLDNMLLLMEHEPSFLLGAVRCLPLPSCTRDSITQAIISSCSKIKDLVFAILIANNQLITLVRMKKYFIHTIDMHILFNLVDASESLKTAESWMPVCLPKFNANGFLQGHVSYLDDNCSACLLLLTVDREMFFQLSESKRKIVEKLKRNNCISAINESVSNQSYKIGHVGIADLRHFMYKSKSTAQYTSPELEAPYLSVEERDRVFGLYLYLHQRIHSMSNPLKILFHVGDKETMLGWVTTGFELYATFEPLVTKLVAINAVNKLLRWIKKEEDRLFILSSPVFT